MLANFLNFVWFTIKKLKKKLQEISKEKKTAEIDRCVYSINAT